jgi:hypothetical protein
MDRSVKSTFSSSSSKKVEPEGDGNCDPSLNVGQHIRKISPVDFAEEENHIKLVKKVPISSISTCEPFENPRSDKRSSKNIVWKREKALASYLIELGCGSNDWTSIYQEIRSRFPEKAIKSSTQLSQHFNKLREEYSWYTEVIKWSGMGEVGDLGDAFWDRVKKTYAQPITVINVDNKCSTNYLYLCYFGYQKTFPWTQSCRCAENRKWRAYSV